MFASLWNILASDQMVYGFYYILVFDPCYGRATVARARFLAAAFSDGSYLAHVNGAYLRHVTFCIVTPFVHRLAYLSTWVAGRCPL